MNEPQSQAKTDFMNDRIDEIRAAREAARVEMRRFLALPAEASSARAAARYGHLSHNNSTRLSVSYLRAFRTDDPAHVWVLLERLRIIYTATRNPVHAWQALVISTKWRLDEAGQALLVPWCADFLNSVARSIMQLTGPVPPTASQVAAAVGIMRKGRNAVAKCGPELDTFFAAERAVKLQGMGFTAERARGAAFGDRITNPRTLRRTAKRALPRDGG